MKDWVSQRVVFGLSAVFLFGMLCAPAIADEPQPKTEQKVEKEPGRRGRGKNNWLQRIGLMRAPGEHEKSHEKVTAAFREVLAQPSKATVRVMNGDAQVALGAI